MSKTRMEVEFKIKFDIDEKDFDVIKKLEHHADYLLDLKEYPEIKRIYDCKITPLKMVREEE